MKVGPEWKIFVQTFLEIAGVTIVFIIFVAEMISRILTYLTIILLFINLLFFTTTACSDPGIIFQGHQRPEIEIHDLESDDNNGNRGAQEYSNTLSHHPNPNTLECAQCHVQRPPTARHCYKCGVCIDKVADPFPPSTSPHLAQLDHHCPFTGKCIGKKNMIPFLIFFGSINLLGLLVFGVTAYYVIGVVILSTATKK
jgi:palmitoyltransferase ZDHHC9/14/18